MLKWLKPISVMFVILLGLAAMYFAAAGYVVADLDNRLESELKQEKTPTGAVIYKGVEFASIYDVRMLVERDKVGTFFAWVYDVPPSLPLLITAFAFGLLGGCTNTVYKAIGAEDLSCSRILLKPVFGGLIGWMVLGITFVLPAALTVDHSRVRPLSLAFLCLYGGVFSNHVYLWLEEKIKSVFTLSKAPEARP